MKDAIQDVEATLISKFNDKVHAPLRTVLEFPEKEATAIYMPSAEVQSNVASVKVVTIFPQNPEIGLPTTQGIIVLTGVENGKHLAVMNASYLTRLRTGAISALATSKLSKEHSKVLTIIGTGAMAFEQTLGILAVREIETMLLFNRTTEKAHQFKEKLIDHGVKANIKVVGDVNSAVSMADIVCCATKSTTPVFDGDYLKPGTHVIGVGSYLPTMCEIDRTTILRASKIVVDDLEGVTEEAGELIEANHSGEWTFDNIHGELELLVNNKIAARENDEEITFFKSVGASYYDLAVAKGVYLKALENNIGILVDL